jgi:hypothetical protein
MHSLATHGKIATIPRAFYQTPNFLVAMDSHTKAELETVQLHPGWTDRLVLTCIILVNLFVLGQHLVQAGKHALETVQSRALPAQASLIVLAIHVQTELLIQEGRGPVLVHRQAGNTWIRLVHCASTVLQGTLATTATLARRLCAGPLRTKHSSALQARTAGARPVRRLMGALAIQP